MNDTNRVGDWILTYTGKKFYVMDPRPEDICIEDIAHGLSNMCRFSGQCRTFYSVAQHSLIVSDHCPDAELQGLMHDATEAYIGDMVRPLKHSMPAYKTAELKLWACICEKFGMPIDMHPQVKAADNRALMTERRDLMITSDHEWSIAKDFPPYAFQIEPWSPAYAKDHFTRVFNILFTQQQRGVKS